MQTYFYEKLVTYLSDIYDSLYITENEWKPTLCYGIFIVLSHEKMSFALKRMIFKRKFRL